ncbi:50S ribosomal protein L15 [Mycoplasmopsis agassizii]|uniref:Large ribosomal subunit protein uL15 n=1 Tax=Mycoplasmopsis agassizii TaxID=33922 RepID=A0ABX4H667_9BACT|nr:50S ribosomal protein L15 [Mycoplasmopsis agassizii]PAF55389.1 50S ribosomal protein L15 [Mycoplasmopsis agassizii]SMC18244.1 large subunit ribosomal protein L15 [Mycoplasmopsis agassizii]
MKLSELKANPGSRKEKHRVGRGHAAGKGKQAGKGQSGQAKRSGTKAGFEGGQNPWFRRLPKRGFNNVNHVEYQVVNLGVLNERFENKTVIDIELLVKERLANRTLPVKLLNKGSLEKSFTIKVNAASEAAKEAVKKAGGSVEVI